MSDFRLQRAKRRIARAEARVARQRQLLHDLKKDQHAAAATRAEQLLRVFEDSLALHRVHYDRLCRDFGIDCRQFHIAASMSDNGASIAIGPLDTHAAVMKAIELADEGYDRIVLKDAATHEEMHFRPPTVEI